MGLMLEHFEFGFRVDEGAGLGATRIDMAECEKEEEERRESMLRCRSQNEVEGGWIWDLVCCGPISYNLCTFDRVVILPKCFLKHIISHISSQIPNKDGKIWTFIMSSLIST
ncbi:hypothetical protein FF1_003426 [Malus domestica]